VSSVTVADSRWNSGSFTWSDVIFKFFGNMRVEVTCIYVDFTIRISDFVGSACGRILQRRLRSGSRTRTH